MPLSLLAFYSYFAFGALFQLFPPVFGAVMAEFAVSRQAVALTMSLFMAPLVLLAVPAGLAADRFPVRVVGWGALLLMALGAAITALAGSFAQLLVGRVVSGVGASLVLASTLKLIAQRVPQERLGLVLGIFAVGLPAGTGVAFNLLTALALSLGWRAAAFADAIIAVSALAVFQGVMRHMRHDAAGGSATFEAAQVFRHAELWRIALVTVFAYMAIIAFTTWAPTTLVRDAGLPLWVAAALASLLLVIDIPFAPLWGRLSDRLGRRKVFIVAAFVVYLLGSLVVPRVARVPEIAVPGLLVVIGVMGIGCSMFFPAALAIPAENVGPEVSGAAYGVLFTAQFAGMMGGPSLIAFVLEAAGSDAGFLTISAVTLGGLLLSLTLKSR